MAGSSLGERQPLGGRDPVGAPGRQTLPPSATVRYGPQPGGTQQRKKILMVTIDDVRAVAAGLPRSTEVLVRRRVKFRVGQIVYLAFSRDQTVMGFAFPKAWRPIVLESEPHKFLPPDASDVRYNWLNVRLAAIDESEMRDLVLDAWRMVVPKRVAAAYDGRPRTAR
jgi:hypothetical protein